MRISDWSSDVCSSDLFAAYRARDGRAAELVVERRHIPVVPDEHHTCSLNSAIEPTKSLWGHSLFRFAISQLLSGLCHGIERDTGNEVAREDRDERGLAPTGDRKSDVEGKHVADSEDSGGRRERKK